MSSSAFPSDLPPAYTKNQTSSGAAANASSSAATSDIPEDHRRSMEEESLPLPQGWIRQFDPASNHHFYVDTLATPPRSIWIHPYNDPDFIASIPDTDSDHHVSSSDPASSAEAEKHRLQQQHLRADARAKYADSRADTSSSSIAGSSSSHAGSSKLSLGERIKNKIAGGTKEERAQKKAERAKREQEAYQDYLRRREALIAQQQQIYAQRMQARQAHYPYYPANSFAYAPPQARYQTRPGYNGLGGGNAAGLPILGGLAGGLLLGVSHTLFLPKVFTFNDTFIGPSLLNHTLSATS